MYQCSQQLLQKQMLSHVPGVSEKIVDAKENVLDAPCYHVVFTVPGN